MVKKEAFYGQSSKGVQFRKGFFFESEESGALSGVEFALFGEVRQLSPEDQQDVLNFIRYKRSLQEKRKDHDPAD